MFRTISAAALLGLAAACTPAMDGPNPAITALLDKTLVHENGTVFLIRSDGTVGGTFRGEAIVGTWTQDTDGAICSTYSAPAPLASASPCSLPAVDGNTVTFNRRDGSQSVYTIQG